MVLQQHDLTWRQCRVGNDAPATPDSYVTQHANGTTPTATTVTKCEQLLPRCNWVGDAGVGMTVQAGCGGTAETLGEVSDYSIRLEPDAAFQHPRCKVRHDHHDLASAQPVSYVFRPAT